jgi:hypothetical protein
MRQGRSDAEVDRVLHEMAFERRVVRMRDRGLVEGRPQSPRRIAQLVLVVLAARFAMTSAVA